MTKLFRTIEEGDQALRRIAKIIADYLALTPKTEKRKEFIFTLFHNTKAMLTEVISAYKDEESTLEKPEGYEKSILFCQAYLQGLEDLFNTNPIEDIWGDIFMELFPANAKIRELMHFVANQRNYVGLLAQESKLENKQTTSG